MLLPGDRIAITLPVLVLNKYRPASEESSGSSSSSNSSSSSCSYSSSSSSSSCSCSSSSNNGDSSNLGSHCRHSLRHEFALSSQSSSVCRVVALSSSPAPHLSAH